MKLRKRHSGPVGFQNKIRIEKGTDRVALKILRRSYPFRRKVPIGKIVDL